MTKSDLTILLNDIDSILSKGPSMDNEDRHFLMQSIYLLETEIDKIKSAHKLHRLDNSINSKSIEKSFLRKLPSNINIKSQDNYEFKEYLKPIDYQYWFMIYLLLKNKEIRESKITLLNIIDKFIDRIKNESFNYEDIKIMASGATRCKTNLRFTVNSLRQGGYINYFDQNHKQSWSLTYIGFFIALTFCLHPDEERNNPFSKNIHKTNVSPWLFDLDPILSSRVSKLSDKSYFNELIEKLKLDSLGLVNLENGSNIFENYHSFFDEISRKGQKYKRNEKQVKDLYSEYFDKLNGQYSLQGFMNDVSEKFNAEDYFNDLYISSNINK